MAIRRVGTFSPARSRVMVVVFFFLSGFGFSTWASRIPTIQQQLHLNEAQLGAVLPALPVGLMLTVPVTGMLLSRLDSRIIMMGRSADMSSGSAIAAVSTVGYFGFLLVPALARKRPTGSSSRCYRLIDFFYWIIDIYDRILSPSSLTFASHYCGRTGVYRCRVAIIP